MPSPHGAAPPADTEQQIAAFIDKFDPAIAALMRACRAALRARFPTAFELVYDNYNALAIGYAASEKTSHCIISIAAYLRNVNLFFYYGVSLSDPDKLLQGNGSQVRFIRLENADLIEDTGTETLIASAIAQSKQPLPASGAIRTIVKSVSVRQRLRRS